MAPYGLQLAQLVNLLLNYPIVSRSLLPDITSFSAVSPQTDILLLIYASLSALLTITFSLTQSRVMSQSVHSALIACCSCDFHSSWPMLHPPVTHSPPECCPEDKPGQKTSQHTTSLLFVRMLLSLCS